MRRWTLRILVGLIVLIVLAALSGITYQWVGTRRDLASTPPPGHLVNVGGHRLHVWCTGAGTPVVILDAGLGGSSPGWGFVQPDVARFTRVCSYDRAGMGYSDPGPSPRTARRIASELAELLDRSAIDQPVVLVGASSGGFNVRVFASDHPKRVAGLVLVDASHEDRHTRFLGSRGLSRSYLHWAFFGCLVCHSAFQSNRWRQRYGNSRERPDFAPLGIKRPQTK